MITNFDVENLLDGVIGQLTFDSSLLKATNSYLSENNALKDKVPEFEKVIVGNLEMIEKLKEVAKEWTEDESIAS